MGKTKKISGTVTYQNISTGFWSIIGQNGEQWLPVNLPVHLQTEGRSVSLTVKKLEGDNKYMWGTTVQIV